MSILTDKLFWLSSIERAIRTFAQTFVATVTVSIGMDATAWGASLVSSLIAALLSLMTSVAMSGVGGDGPGITESVNEPELVFGDTPADDTGS